MSTPFGPPTVGPPAGPPPDGPARFDVAYVESRNRLTTAFRLILAIPHLVVRQVWQYLAHILAVIQWFVIVFTGKRNRGMWDLQQAWMGYNARVTSYVGLMSDPYPAFGTTLSPQEQVAYDLAFSEQANRLTSGLRFLWIIPAAVIAIFVGIAGCAVTVVSWFAILFTGKHSRGMFDFLLRVNRFVIRLTAYALLMTDVYPKFE